MWLDREVEEAAPWESANPVEAARALAGRIDKSCPLLASAQPFQAGCAHVCGLVQRGRSDGGGFDSLPLVRR